MENPEAKLRCHRKEVIKDVRLDVLVGCPVLDRAETVNFDGEAQTLRGELPDQQRHFLVDVGMVAQIGLDVGAEGPHIGESPTVHLLVFPVFWKRGVGGVDFLPFRFKIFGDMLDLLEACEHFIRAEADRVGVDEQASFDASATAFRHAPPVFERAADECVGWNGGDGFVPVSNFDRGEADLFDIAVGVAQAAFDVVFLKKGTVDIIAAHGHIGIVVGEVVDQTGGFVGLAWHIAITLFTGGAWQNRLPLRWLVRAFASCIRGGPGDGWIDRRGADPSR